jgi:hypothetical protein
VYANMKNRQQAMAAESQLPKRSRLRRAEAAE